MNVVEYNDIQRTARKLANNLLDLSGNVQFPVYYIEIGYRLVVRNEEGKIVRSQEENIFLTPKKVNDELPDVGY